MSGIDLEKKLICESTHAMPWHSVSLSLSLSLHMALR